MKKASKIAFVAMMGLLLFGCGKKKETSTNNKTNVTTKAEKKATLVYSAGDGATIPGSKLGAEVVYGKSFTLDVPTKKGSTFKGWYIREGITRIDLTDANGKSLKAFDYEFSGSELTIYADWTTEVETVTFNSCGGSDINAQKVEYGSYASRPDTNPTRDGYTFDDWYTKEVGGEKWTFTSTQVLADTTIYAHWTPKQYVLDFDTDDDSMGTVSCSITDAVVDCGTSFTLTATEKEGYTFDCWYYYKDADLSTRIPLDNGTSKTVTLTMPAYNVSYLAVWTTCELTTQKVGDGSINELNSANITAGTTVELVATPGIGSTFAGWYYGEEQVIAPSDCTYTTEDSYKYTYIMPKASLTLTAKFVVNTHTITLSKSIDIEGETGEYGEVSQSGNGTYTYGESVTLTATPAEGYSFNGWYDNDQKTYLSITSGTPFNMFDRDLNLTAVFTYYEVIVSKSIGRATSEEYGNVTIDGDNITSKKVTNGNTVTLTATVEEGYSFDGWWDVANGGWLDVTGISCWDPSITLTIDYSGYELEARFTYYLLTITLRDTDSSYGTISEGACTNTKVSLGTEVNATAAYTQGSTVFEFLGWFESEDAEAPVLDTLEISFEMWDADVYLEARFAPKKFAITYALDGGTNNEDNPAFITYTDNLPITLKDPSKKGYTFAGWTENGSAVTEISGLQTHTYTATWTVNSYTITFGLTKHKIGLSTIGFGKYSYKIADGSYSTVWTSTENYHTTSVTYGDWVYINLTPYLGRAISADAMTSSQVTLDGTVSGTVYSVRYLFDQNVTIMVDFLANEENSALKYFDFTSNDSSCNIQNFKSGMESAAATEQRLNIPSYVTNIAEGSLKYFSSLETLFIPFTGQYYGASGEYALFSYIFPANTYTNAVAVKQVYLSSSTLTATSYRYIPNSLRSVNIYPSGNYSIPDCAFAFDTNTSNSYPTNFTNVDYSFDSGYTLKGIGKYAFYGFKSLKDFGLWNTGNCDIRQLGENSTIGDYAFAMTNVKDVYVTTIGSHDKLTFGHGIFDGCPNVRSLDLPFVGKNISAPDTYNKEYTLAYTFFGSTNGGSNTVKANFPTTVGTSETFEENSNIAYMPKELTVYLRHTGNIPVAAFDLRRYVSGSASNFAQDYIIKLYGLSTNYSSIVINDFAFSGLENTLFELFNNHEYITSIGQCAFKQCYCFYTSDNSFYKFKKLAYIGNYAFQNVIGTWAKARLEARNKTLYTSVSFTNTSASTLSVGIGAFFGCSLINSVSVSSNIYFANDVFYSNEASSITKINFNGTKSQWNTLVTTFSANWRRLGTSGNISSVSIDGTSYTMADNGTI